MPPFFFFERIWNVIPCSGFWCQFVPKLITFLGAQSPDSDRTLLLFAKAIGPKISPWRWGMGPGSLQHDWYHDRANVTPLPSQNASIIVLWAPLSLKSGLWHNRRAP